MINNIKKLKYSVVNIYYVLRRTLFSFFLGIKLPIKNRIDFKKHVKIGNRTRFYLYDGEGLFGKDTIICDNSKFILGDGKIQIGDSCILGEYGIYNVFSDIFIGNDVITADRVSFVTNIHEYSDIHTPIKNQLSNSDSIYIGDGSWIGMNVTILAGSKIGKNCVVAAHSVVKGTFPDNCVIGGIPSKILKKYNPCTNSWEKA